MLYNLKIFRYIMMYNLKILHYIMLYNLKLLHYIVMYNLKILHYIILQKHHNNPAKFSCIQTSLRLDRVRFLVTA
jgi:hypothetical protein